MKNLVILPTYNERDNIEKIVENIRSSFNADILIVDDNSPDGTGELADNLSKNFPNVSVIHRQNKKGLGTAYICAFKHAVNSGFDNIFTMDADFSHNPKYLPELAKLLEKRDFAIGSRYLPGGGIENWPLLRKIISKAGNFYARAITQMPIKDCTSGFMATKSDILKQCGYENVISEGYCFLIELKWLLFKKSSNFSEIPIIFSDRLAGKSKISKKIIFEAVFHVWKLRLNLEAKIWEEIVY